MTGSKIRVALAGFGAWGQMHARAIEAIADAEIVSVFCHSGKSEAAAAEAIPDAHRFRDYTEMLEAGGYDVVDVAVPNYVHADFAVQALEAGADVFLEKPLGVTLEQCDRVIDAAAAAGRQVSLNHELRVSRQWEAVRDILKSGELGRVRYQHFSLFRHEFRQGSGGWRYDPERVGSWILEELVHFYDLVLWYASENGKPRSVRAFGNGTDGGLTQNFSTVLEWDDGSIAVLTQCLGGFEHHTLLEVAGETGGIRTWWSGAQDRTLHPEFELKVKRGASDVEAIAIPKSGEVFELEENLRAAFEGFRSGRSILSPQQARVAIEVCLAAEEAYRKGTAVELTSS